MTRKTTWSNPDGLVVGFGPNFPERQDGAVLAQEGSEFKQAKLHITYQSTLGSTGAKIPVPAGSLVRFVYIKVNTNWAGGTSLAFGDTNSTGGWVTATQGGVANLVTTNSPINAQGAYAFTSTEGQLPPKPYPAALDLFFTAVGTFTAGDLDVYVEYA